MIGGGIAMGRRQDGGYTVADGATLHHAATPSTFRFGSKFMAALLMDVGATRLSLGREFLQEWSIPTAWPLDQISPFEKCRVLDPKPNHKTLRRIRRRLDQVFPQLAATPIAETWAGMIEATPDVIPVIDAADGFPGFYMATGFSGHGFGIGPGAGKAIAGLLTGYNSGIDLREFRLSRFSDGTPIRPQTSI